MKEFIFRNRSAWQSYLLALLMAVLLIWFLFTSDFLKGHAAFFETLDPGQHLSGWLFYRYDQWRFPLTYTQKLNYPQGVSIVMTDSIPLAAVILKIFRQWLPQGFQYFGWWHALAYLLQAFSAAALIRVLGFKSLLATFVAVGFALLVPELTLRFPHTSLLTQGLIMLAFCAYFSGMKEEKLISYSVILVLISIISLLIHPYLFAMTYPIYLVFLIDWGFRQKEFKYCFISFLFSLIILLVTFTVFGYFNVHGAEGFGLFSMNLLAPVCGGKFSLPCTYGTTGQYEGYNYLGLGLILILIIVFAVQIKWFMSLPKRFPALTILMVLFLLFAISNKIYFGPYKIMEIKFSTRMVHIISVFQGSGRFFWPVGYLLLFVAIVGLLRWQNQTAAAFILLSCLLLQWLDVQNNFNFQKKMTEQPATLNFQNWQALYPSVVAMDIFPFVEKYSGDVKRYQFFLLWAGQAQWSVNTVSSARVPTYSYLKEHFFDQPLIKNHLYIIMPDVTTADIPANLKILLQKGDCRHFYLADKSRATACIVSTKEP